MRVAENAPSSWAPEDGDFEWHHFIGPKRDLTAWGSDLLQPLYTSKDIEVFMTRMGRWYGVPGGSAYLFVKLWGRWLRLAETAGEDVFVTCEDWEAET